MIYAIITDIHEDIESLKKVISKISELNIKNIICLGDITGFDRYYNKAFEKTKSANKCIELIKSKSIHVVIGNHDLNTIRKIPTKSSFIFPKNWYSLPLEQKEDISKGKILLHSGDIETNLSDTNNVYLNSIQEEIFLQNMLISHFLHPNITGFEKVDNNHLELIKEHFNYMFLKKCNISFIGHLHNFGLQIITNNNIYTIQKNTEYKISSDLLNIIVCPPVVKSSKNIPAYTLYNDKTKTIKWNHI